MMAHSTQGSGKLILDRGMEFRKILYQRLCTRGIGIRINSMVWVRELSRMEIIIKEIFYRVMPVDMGFTIM